MPATEKLQASQSSQSGTRTTTAIHNTTTIHDATTIQNATAVHNVSIELERISEGATVLPDAKSSGAISLSNKGDGSPPSADPLSLLPEHEAEVLRRQVETPDIKFGMFAVYRYATTVDILILIVSIVMSLAAGASLPAMTIIFGGLQGIFAQFLAQGSLTLDEFKQEMSRYVLYFVYLAIGTFVANYISSVGFLYTGEHIASKLRMRYLESCLRQNIGFFDKLGAGEVAVKITSDANTVQEGISEKVGLFFNSLATLLTGFLIGFIISWKLTLILSATFFAQFINTGIGASFIIKYGTTMGVAFGHASSLAQEVLSSVRVATAFGSQDRLATRYDGHLAISQRWGTKMKFCVGMMMAVVMCLLYLNYGLGFWQGATFLRRRELSMSDMLTTIMSVMLGSFNVGALGPYFQAFSEAAAMAAKLLTVIDRKTPLDATSDEGETPSVVEGHIRLENVRHIYPSRPAVTVMDGVSLDIPAGKVTALVGASGSGKSTIIGLVERFYKPIGGEIHLDGIDISTLNLRWLRQQIGLVGQEPVLFAVSIFENIRYGLVGTDHELADEATQREMIIEASRKANAHEFISQLSDGYDTNVGQRGFLLSGGQKQRVAIARAIVSNPKILLLDEATSALDTKSEGVVQAALDKASAGRTTITIAHRLSTVREAHKIVVMSGGKVAEEGTHLQLLELRGAYHDLIRAQQFDDEKKRAETVDEEELDEEQEKLLRRLSTKNIGTLQLDPVETASRRSSMHRRVSLPHNRLSSTFGTTRENQESEDEPDYPTWTLVKFIFGFNRPEAILMVMGVIFCIISGLANPVQAVFFAKQMIILADMNVAGFDNWKVQKESDFWSLMFLMLGLVVLLAQVIQAWAFSKCSEALIRRVRKQSLQHILRQDISYFDREENNAGALTAMLAVETTHLASISGSTLGGIINSLTNLVAGLAVSLAIGWKLALVCFSVVPVLLACGFFRIWLINRYQSRVGRSYAESASFAAENISSMKTVASLTLEQFVAKTYRETLEDQQRKGFASVAKSSILFAASNSVVFLCVGLGFWYGSTLMATGEYDIFEFFVCLMAIIFGAQSAGTFFTFIPELIKAKHAAAQLKMLFSRKPAIDSWETKGKPLPEVGGHLEFRNVYFRYPTRPEKHVLRGLDLKVEPGQHVALVGSSGCGKSTTISLLERFYDPLIGQVLIDGKDITQYQVQEYRSHIALVSQEPTLYQGSIRDNICMGTPTEEVSDAAIEVACRDANIYDFIVSLPDGFNTDVGSAGGLLSGGQKQRIAIARALIRSPKVLLLDEATSALDSESEHVVQTALDRAAKGRTTVTIAHRLTTIQNADVIYVFDQGRIVETGTHTQLMTLNGRYAELARMQSFS